MESALIFIGSFIITFYIVWFLIKQREKQREKRFREFMNDRKNRKLIEEIENQSLKKNWEHYGRDKNKTSSDRNIPNVSASDRINLNNDTIDSYLYAQEPYVASNDYHTANNHTSSFTDGFGGGDFSGGGSGGSWDDSASSSDTYDSGVTSEPNV